MSFEAFAVSTGVVALAEIGDKTQIATVMLADVPAVPVGDKAVKFVPIVWVHRIAAAVFAALGIAMPARFGR